MLRGCFVGVTFTLRFPFRETMEEQSERKSAE